MYEYHKNQNEMLVDSPYKGPVMQKSSAYHGGSMIDFKNTKKDSFIKWTIADNIHWSINTVTPYKVLSDEITVLKKIKHTCGTTMCLDICWCRDDECGPYTNRTHTWKVEIVKHAFILKCLHFLHPPYYKQAEILKH